VTGHTPGDYGRVELPKISYLVCASQRSGTELLCRGLAATGVAGRPQEYFLAEDPARLPDWRFWEEGPYAAGHDVSDRENYLSLVYRLGSTPNGVFGAKIHWNCLRWALAKFSEMPRFAGLDRVAILRTAFPDLRVVDVTRRDRARQAVSWARMAQDAMWVDPVGQPEPAWPPPTGPPRYDYRLIVAGSLTGYSPRLPCGRRLRSASPSLGPAPTRKGSAAMRKTGQSRARTEIQEGQRRLGSQLPAESEFQRATRP